MDIRTTDDGRRHKRELFVDGEQVSYLFVIDHQMRIGTATVSMAGIGGVHTEWRHRNKGYMRALFEDTLAYMRDQGHDVSMLFGIRNFYSKFGYIACLPAYKIEIQTRDAERAKESAGGHLIREMTPEDMPAVLALHVQNNAQRTCSVLRDPEQFTEFPKGTFWGTPVDAFVVEDRGQVLAYVVCDRWDESVNVAEIESSSDDLYPDILYHLATQAIDKRCEKIGLFLPPDHGFAEYVARYGCEWTINYPRDQNGLMRIINQDSLLLKIQPVLQSRIGATDQHLTDISIETDLGTTALHITAAECTVASDVQTDIPTVCLPQGNLMQLVVGYRSARDVLNAPDVQIDPEAADALGVLFPRGHPYIWHPDHF